LVGEGAEALAGEVGEVAVLVVGGGDGIVGW
jgi:hypothetical protein